MRTSNCQLPTPKGMATKNTMMPFVAALVVALVAISQAAGKSDIADAAMRGDAAAVQGLIAKKGDVNAPQADGATALHWAVYRGDRELAAVLLRAGFAF